MEQLKFTPEQQKQLDAIQKDLKAELEKLLTPEQRKLAEDFRPRGPGGVGGGTTTALISTSKPVATLTLHGKLKSTGEKTPFQLTGDAVEGTLGDPKQEHSGGGVRLLSGEDLNNDGIRAGSLFAVVNGVKDEKGRWYRIRIRALAQEGFAVEKDELFTEVEFFKDNGKNSLDHVAKSLYGQVELERKALLDPGTNKALGSATWRNYSIEVRTPFAEVDTLRVSVGFANGTGKGKRSEFWVSEVDVAPIPDPADYAPPPKTAADKAPPALKSLVKIGGRWYYDPQGGSKELPKQFDRTNADRLYYLAEKLETPFVGNMSAWMKPGYLDVQGKLVEKDQFVPDSVVVTFTDKHLVMKSKNLPNHPTAVFPDRSRFLDGNPNSIREQRDTWSIPLKPKENPKHAAYSATNARALPMGPIGVAVNGVQFFNPYDESADIDAVWRLDRCCGHPSPMNTYHYHKYPACVNTPWADDGSAHSPLIGFAFDGYPVYGPYEAKGVLAKDSKTNPLNDFNLHADDDRGPHYHVTPGKLPHILGGYWGEVENRRGPRR